MSRLNTVDFSMLSSLRSQISGHPLGKMQPNLLEFLEEIQVALDFFLEKLDCPDYQEQLFSSVTPDFKEWDVFGWEYKNVRIEEVYTYTGSILQKIENCRAEGVYIRDYSIIESGDYDIVVSYDRKLQLLSEGVGIPLITRQVFIYLNEQLFVYSSDEDYTYYPTYAAACDQEYYDLSRFFHRDAILDFSTVFVEFDEDQVWAPHSLVSNIWVQAPNTVYQYCWDSEFEAYFDTPEMEELRRCPVWAMELCFKWQIPDLYYRSSYIRDEVDNYQENLNLWWNQLLEWMEDHQAIG